MQNFKREFRPNSVIDLKEEDAKRIIEMNYFGWIVSQRDNKFTVMPGYVNEDTVILKIEDSIVTDAYFS